MTIPLDPTLLSRLKALHENITPGEWRDGIRLNRIDALFITEIKDSFPQLLAHIETQAEQLELLNKETWRKEERELCARAHKEFVCMKGHQRIEFVSEVLDGSDCPMCAASGLAEALERIEGMSKRPVCVCGIQTGTAAIIERTARAALVKWRKNHG